MFVFSSLSPPLFMLFCISFQNMFRRFSKIQTPVSEAPKTTFVKRVAKRMQLPESTSSADEVNSAPRIMVDGGRAQKLIVDCDPSVAESVCCFDISNPHKQLM